MSTVRLGDIYPGQGPLTAEIAEPDAHDPQFAGYERELQSRLAGVQMFSIGGIHANHYLLGLLATLVVAGWLQAKA